MNTYKIIRNITLAGVVAGCLGFGKFYPEFDACRKEWGAFEKNNPSVKLVEQVRELDYRIGSLKEFSQRVERVELDRESALSSYGRTPELNSEFNQFKSNYLDKISRNITESEQQKRQIGTSSEYLQIKPRFDLELKKVSRSFDYTSLSGLLMGVSLMCLWLNYAGREPQNRK